MRVSAEVTGHWRSENNTGLRVGRRAGGRLLERVGHESVEGQRARARRHGSRVEGKVIRPVQAVDSGRRGTMVLDGDGHVTEHGMCVGVWVGFGG